MSSASQTTLQLEVLWDPILAHEIVTTSLPVLQLWFSSSSCLEEAHARCNGQQQQLFIKLAEQKTQEKPDSSMTV